MFPLYTYLNVDSKRFAIDSYVASGISSVLTLNTEKQVEEDIPPDNSDKRVFLFEVSMDPKSIKMKGAKLVPPFLVNNPDISILPARTNESPLTTSKQSSVSTVNRVSRVLPLTHEHVTKQEQSSQKIIDSKEIKNNFKRVASNPISNRSEKRPRLSITKGSKSFNLKKTEIKSPEKMSMTNQPKINHQAKKSDSPSKLNNVAAMSISSTSTSGNTVQETTSHQPTKHPIIPDKIRKVDTTDAVIDKPPSEKIKSFLVTSDGLVSNIKHPSKLGFNLKEIVEVHFNCEKLGVNNPMMLNDILVAVAEAFKKYLSKDDIEVLKQNNSSFLHADVFCTPVSKNQTTSQLTPKSQRTTSNHNQQQQQQQCALKQSAQVSSSNYKLTASLNMVPKTPIKQNDTKQQASSNQNPTSSKVLVPALNKFQPVNKQNQKPSTSTSSKSSVLSITPVPPVSKQLVGGNSVQAVKPSNVVCQSPIPDVKKCSKCKSVSEDDLCTTCRMSSHYRCVTLTRIGSPAVQENGNGKGNSKDKGSSNVKDKSNASIKDNSNASIKDNSNVNVKDNINAGVKDNDKDCNMDKDDSHYIQYISSDDDDDDDNDGDNDIAKEEQQQTLEPVITRIETQDILNNYIDKLKLNPKFLDQFLWQKDLGTKDYFKLEKCTSIRLGSFNTKPLVDFGDILICLYGIRMTVNNVGYEPVIIDIEIENIVKIFGYYVTQHSLIIYTNYLAAVGIQHLLKMNENDIGYFDPTSDDEHEKRIIWTFDIKRCEQQQLEKLLLKFPKGKYEPLTSSQAEKILIKAIRNKKDENKKFAITQSEISKKYNAYESIEIYGCRLDGRKVTSVKIVDYRLLAADEFLNDILIEFHLSYFYMRKLSEEDRARSFVFNTFFYTSLTKKFQPPECLVRVEDLDDDTRIEIRHNRVKKWTKNENIFEKDFIFVPINESLHWFMAVICYPNLTGPCLMKDGTPVTLPKSPDLSIHPPYDSGSSSDRDECDGNTENLWNFVINYNEQIGMDYKTDVEELKKQKFPAIKQPCILIFDSLDGGLSRAKVVATLREWLIGEFRATYNMDRDFSPKSMWGGIVKVPQQPNFTDCGLFVMHYFEKFFESPIVDYHCPITHLENWFNTDEIVSDCRKRREIQKILIDSMNEQIRNGVPLPPGITLPEINFVSSSNNSHHNIPPNHPNQSNHSLYLRQSSQNRSQFYDHDDEDDDDDDISENDDVCDEEECEGENYQAEDGEEYQENYRYINGQYSRNYEEFSEELDGDEIPDRGDFYVENGDWSEEGEDQPEEDHNYQSEQDFVTHENLFEDEDDVDMLLPDDGNDMVHMDVHMDDTPASSSGNTRNRVGHHNMDSSNNLRPFRSNYLTIRQSNEDDDESVEPNKLLNHSKKHNKQRKSLTVRGCMGSSYNKMMDYAMSPKRQRKTEDMDIISE